MLFFSSDDLQDIRNKIEREEEKVQTGPPRTKSEVLVKVCVLSFFISDKHFYIYILYSSSAGLLYRSHEFPF